jgi:hypothetical protein
MWPIIYGLYRRGSGFDKNLCIPLANRKYQGMQINLTNFLFVLKKFKDDIYCQRFLVAHIQSKKLMGREERWLTGPSIISSLTLEGLVHKKPTIFCHQTALAKCHHLNQAW